MLKADYKMEQEIIDWRDLAQDSKLFNQKLLQLLDNIIMLNQNLTDYRNQMYAFKQLKEEARNYNRFATHDDETLEKRFKEESKMLKEGIYHDDTELDKLNTELKNVLKDMNYVLYFKTNQSLGVWPNKANAISSLQKLSLKEPLFWYGNDEIIATTGFEFYSHADEFMIDRAVSPNFKPLYRWIVKFIQEKPHYLGYVLIDRKTGQYKLLK